MTLTASEARILANDPETIPDDQLGEAWTAIAGQISYLNADDHGQDWKQGPLWRPSLVALDVEHDRRGLPRPSRAGWLL